MENKLENLLRSYDYAVIPSDGVGHIFQDGKIIRFVNKDSFHKIGEENGES